MIDKLLWYDCDKQATMVRLW